MEVAFSIGFAPAPADPHGQLATLLQRLVQLDLLEAVAGLLDRSEAMRRRESHAGANRLAVHLRGGLRQVAPDALHGRLLEDAGRCSGGVAGLQPADLPIQRRPQTGEVVIAVPDGVILQDELAGQRRVGVERDRSSPVKLLVAEPPDDGCRCRAVGPQ